MLRIFWIVELFSGFILVNGKVINVMVNTYHKYTLDFSIRVILISTHNCIILIQSLINYVHNITNLGHKLLLVKFFTWWPKIVFTLLELCQRLLLGALSVLLLVKVPFFKRSLCVCVWYNMFKEYVWFKLCLLT